MEVLLDILYPWYFPGPPTYRVLRRCILRLCYWGYAWSPKCGVAIPDTWISNFPPSIDLRCFATVTLSYLRPHQLKAALHHYATNMRQQKRKLVVTPHPFSWAPTSRILLSQNVVDVIMPSELVPCTVKL